MPTEKKPEYSPGLAGVIAGETAICWVDPNAGLMYRGYDIHEMAQKASFEEVAYLLLNGELPNGKQLVEFTQQIAAERALPGPVTEMLRLLPKRDASDGHVAHRRIDARRVRQGSERLLARREHPQIDSADRARFHIDH